MDAKAVVDALARKHNSDVFVSECKTGPSAGSCPRLDAWVMIKSWAHPRTIGYEVKVSRGDWMQDNKWQNYLTECNELMFACPWGLIPPEEVPESTGLLWVAKGGGRTVTKKKAPWRDVPLPRDLVTYILMWRATIGPIHVMETEAEYWQRWLETRDEKKDLGYKVSHKLRELIDSRIEAVEKENRRLKSRNDSLEDVRVLLHERGIDIDGWNVVNAVERAIQGSGMIERLSRAQAAIGAVLDKANPAPAE